MWRRLIDWFRYYRDRNEMIREWNRSARNSFIAGETSTLLQARITFGSSNFRHSLSMPLQGGFRIKAISAQALQRSELREIGQTVIDNQIKVRLLVSMGWDTLEVEDANGGSRGFKWELIRHIGNGGQIQ